MSKQPDPKAASASTKLPPKSTPHDAALDRDWSGKNPLLYPDPAVEYLDKRFRRVAPPPQCAVQRLATGFRFTEGPCWFGDHNHLLFVDVPGNKIIKWSEDSGEISTYRDPSQHANGLTRDRQGRLITCEGGSRRVTRTEFDGTVTILCDKVDGKRLNSPNDLVVHPDGGIWFTDPDYGLHSYLMGTPGESEVPQRVYRIDPNTGKVKVMADDPKRPNGLCFSPDYSLLYVVDSKLPWKEMYVYDVIDGERLSKARIFIPQLSSFADGIRCDIEGNVWSSAGWGGPGSNGVHVYAPDGDLIGKIHLPEVCANVCFGGYRKTRLFMAASQSLYAVYTNTQGALYP